MSRPPTDRPKVMVVEDTAVTRSGLTAEFERAGFSVEAVPDASGCRAKLPSREPDLIVSDLYLDGESGPPAFAFLRELTGGGHRVIVYSTWALDPDVLTLMDLGVRAYLQKSSDLEPLLHAARWAIDAPAESPPLLTAEVAGAMQRRERFGLTAAEIEVLTYVSQHLSNAEIAALRFVSEDTVKTQLASIRAKLGARNRSAAVRSAHQYGLIGKWRRGGRS